MSSPLSKIPVRDVDPKSAEVDLYEVRKKIYPRAVSGVFAAWRWALVVLTQVIFYGLPWLVWNGRQAVLFDLAGASGSISSAWCSGRRTSSFSPAC